MNVSERLESEEVLEGDALQGDGFNFVNVWRRAVPENERLETNRYGNEDFNCIII